MAIADVPICYVGDGLGAAPVTRVRRGLAKIHWNRHDRRVQLLTEEDAASLLRSNPEDFRACATVAEVAASPSAQAAGLTAERLMEMGAAGTVHVETYHAKAGGEEVPMLVLDSVTAAGIDAIETPTPPRRPRGRRGAEE